MVLNEGYSVNLDVVDLGSKLHAFVLLSSDDGPDVGAVNADNAVLDLLFLSQRDLLTEIITPELARDGYIGGSF